MQFITDMRQQKSIPIERTCLALSQAGIRFSARAYRTARHRAASRREVQDEQIKDKLRALHTEDEQGRKAPESLYGYEKCGYGCKTMGSLTLLDAQWNAS